MRSSAPLALVSILALSCRGLKLNTKCSSGASCVHSQNGVEGPLEVRQACNGANCGVDYGNPAQAGPQVQPNQNSQRFPQNNQNNQRFPQNNQNNPRFPQKNQGGSRVTVNDNCSSGSQCSQNIGAGGQVQSTQRCNGAQCQVNYQQPAGAGGQGVGGQGVGGQGVGGQGVGGQGVGGQGSWTQGAGGQGAGGQGINGQGAGGQASGTEVVNCGAGIRSVFQNTQNIVEVTCNSGKTKVSRCPAGAYTQSSDRKRVTITCAGGAGASGSIDLNSDGSISVNARSRGGNRRGGGFRRNGGNRVINRNCSGNNCNVNFS